MPRVFRAMLRDDDGFPRVERSARGLGIRPGIDIDVGPSDNVLVNGKGMSVGPNWRDLPHHRVPERLRHLKRGARGPSNIYCFRSGSGPFQKETFAKGLMLEPDSSKHGVIAPDHGMSLDDYESALRATRPTWQVDET